MNSLQNSRPQTNNTGMRSRKPQIPLMMKVVRWTYPKVERLAPAYAHQWFVKLFFSPPRYPIPVHEKQFAHSAEQIDLHVANKKIKAYSWGKGPVILFVHGWAGRATQFSHFIEPFTQAGFRAIALDAPAHGLSEGTTTNIFEFKDSILALEKYAGSIYAVISHSLGGTATLFSLTEGLPAEKLITIATPTLGNEIIHEYAVRLQGSEQSKKYLEQFIHQKFNRPFDSLMASHFAKQLTKEISMLIIHDEHDKEASLQNAHHLRNAYPTAKFKQTQGLGHVRILKDMDVIKTCLQFIRL